MNLSFLNNDRLTHAGAAYTNSTRMKRNNCECHEVGMSKITSSLSGDAILPSATRSEPGLRASELESEWL